MWSTLKHQSALRLTHPRQLLIFLEEADQWAVWITKINLR